MGMMLHRHNHVEEAVEPKQEVVKKPKKAKAQTKQTDGGKEYDGSGKVVSLESNG